MLKRLLSDTRPFAAIVCVLVCVGGGLVYLTIVKQQTAPDVKVTRERLQQPSSEIQTPLTEVPVGDTSQGGHFHEDGTWHAEPHETDAAAQPQHVGSETPRGNKFFTRPHWSDAFLPEDIEAAYADDPEALEIARAVRIHTERDPRTLTPTELYESGRVLVEFGNAADKILQEWIYAQDPEVSAEDKEKALRAFERLKELMRLKLRFHPEPLDPVKIELLTQ